MTIKEALKWGASQLREAGVDLPELEAELLLAHSTIRANGTVNRAWLFARGEKQVRRSTIKKYKKLIARRARREPVAYILGHKEFYGLEFTVSRDVLIPRPETETLVEEARAEVNRWQVLGRRFMILDVGTGSGAIIISLAKQLNFQYPRPRRVRLGRTIPNIQFFATDISPSVLRVARKNAWRQGVEKQIKFLCGNLLQPLLHSTPYLLPTHLVIIANLPYLPTAEWRATPPEIKKWEPRNALDGGKDGLKYYREMFEQLRGANSESSANLRISNSQIRKFGSHSQFVPITCFCEICPHQVMPFKKMVREYFKLARFKVIKDLSGRARVVRVKL